MSELPQTTSSGRVVKRTGMNDSKKSALQKIREARQGNVKRTDQYEVRTILTCQLLSIAYCKCKI